MMDGQNLTEVQEQHINLIVMSKKLELKIGDKVHFKNEHNPSITENGIVKSIGENTDKVFVVYHCNQNWEHYEEYMAQRTDLKYLYLGWN